jgi:uncharacterized protein YndB with AHSA1/START domain
MVDILHKVGIRSSAADAYEALTSREALANWWTNDTKGKGDVGGGVLHFRFGERGFFDMKVVELDPARHVAWEVVGGPEEWIGTRVTWNIRQDDDYATVLFRHEGWREPVEFMHHCSTKWATFLMSLKSLLETGSGAPWPNDVKIEKMG